MPTYSYSSVQKIPVDIGTAWAFFSNPGNLAVLTPSYLDFKIISQHHGPDIYPGQIIEYIIRPVGRIPVHWMTEITHVKAPRYFIDEQRFGPYRFWHHQHHFKEIPGGVEMTDILHYKNPFGILGRMANSLWIDHQIRQIFDHRAREIETLFGKWMPHLSVVPDI